MSSVPSNECVPSDELHSLPHSLGFLCRLEFWRQGESIWPLEPITASRPDGAAVEWQQNQLQQPPIPKQGNAAKEAAAKAIQAGAQLVNNVRKAPPQPPATAAPVVHSAKGPSSNSTDNATSIASIASARDSCSCGIGRMEEEEEGIAREHGLGGGGRDCTENRGVHNRRCFDRSKRRH